MAALSKDEEVLCTIGSPVLYWKRKSLDTKDAEEQDSLHDKRDESVEKRNHAPV